MFPPLFEKLSLWFIGSKILCAVFEIGSLEFPISETSPLWSNTRLSVIDAESPEVPACIEVPSTSRQTMILGPELPSQYSDPYRFADADSDMLWLHRRAGRTTASWCHCVTADLQHKVLNRGRPNKWQRTTLLWHNDIQSFRGRDIERDILRRKQAEIWSRWIKKLRRTELWLDEAVADSPVLALTS